MEKEVMEYISYVFFTLIGILMGKCIITIYFDVRRIKGIGSNALQSYEDFKRLIFEKIGDLLAVQKKDMGRFYNESESKISKINNMLISIESILNNLYLEQRDVRNKIEMLSRQWEALSLENKYLREQNKSI